MITFSLIIGGALVALPFQRFNQMHDCQVAGINMSMMLDSWKGYKIECSDVSAGDHWMIAAGDGKPTPRPSED